MEYDLIELLAPAGNEEKLNTALYFGADAVYLGGDFGLRAQSGFSDEGIVRAIETVHRKGKKAYITLNIYARNSDFGRLDAILSQLSAAKADAVIVSDLGVLSFVRNRYPHIPVHVSTQANTTNLFAARFYENLGATRIVLARELSISEISEIRAALKPETELECFVHGAMCVSYSGRCLLSHYLTGRDANRGNCVQACRWRYRLVSQHQEVSSELEIEEDARGAYILNSKDLNMLKYLRELRAAGVTSFKIEGRMKTAYYLACVVNAYRRAIDAVSRGENVSDELVAELEKVSNRGYTTGFYFGEDVLGENVTNESRDRAQDFCGVILKAEKNRALVEMRNRFRIGDRLEIVSPFGEVGRSFVVDALETLEGEPATDAKLVQQKLWTRVGTEVQAGDFLRKSERADGI